jgi:hypothetical protein
VSGCQQATPEQASALEWTNVTEWYEQNPCVMPAVRHRPSHTRPCTTANFSGRNCKGLYPHGSPWIPAHASPKAPPAAQPAAPPDGAGGRTTGSWKEDNQPANHALPLTVKHLALQRQNSNSHRAQGKQEHPTPGRALPCTAAAREAQIVICGTGGGRGPSQRLTT